MFHNLNVVTLSSEESMSKTFRRHSFREKEARNVILEFSEKVKAEAAQLFESKRHVETIEAADAKIYLIDGKPLLASFNGKLFPTLFFNEVFSFLPKIVVDMGAISYICNGADVMAPGVIRIEGQFDVDDFVLVVDERHSKPLAIGFALLNSQMAKQTKHGRIVKNLHHVGDKLWASLKNQR
jgi:PUA domain protein